MKKLFFAIFLINGLLFAQPKVLIVNAHPDDESGCAATVYKITQELGGTVELAVVTNGEAGYKYSILAEKLYGQPLTKEAVGRQYLPKIRKKELKAGCKWVGINKIHFYDQLDTHYTLDADTVLTQVWNVNTVKQSLRQLIEKNHYDYIFCLLPTEQTHGHHKAATILALETVKALPENLRPTILGVSVSSKTDTTEAKFTGLVKYPITAIQMGKPDFQLDRNASFGFKNRLNYKIVVNWLIAEHKSQGTMQTFMGSGDTEHFWFFDVNAKERREKTVKFFEQLANSRPKSLN
ncbi:MAG: PIG-L family deacetylase [Bacteroidia bacterium]